MRVLFVLPAAPLSSDYSGAATRYAQNFAALSNACKEVHVLRIDTHEEIAKVSLYETASPSAESARRSSTSWTDLEDRSVSRSRLSLLRDSAFDPVRFEFPRVDATAQSIGKVVSRITPDLLWVEGTEMAAAVARLSISIPWVFSHHDIMFRVRRVRHNVRRLKDKWFLRVCQRAEELILRATPYAITGSTTDAERLRALRGINVYVVPVSYENDIDIPQEAEPAEDLRIVHLGSVETTANRVGLESYLRRAHYRIVTECKGLGVTPALWIVGDNSRAKQPLSALLSEAGAALKGFVPDLSSVLRPYDLSILPYEHDTGFRTKLPLLCKYAQAIVATRASVAGTSLTGIETACVLVDSVEQFPSEIARLASDPTERKRRGRAARDFFLRHFTSEAVESQFRNVLKEIGAGWSESCRGY